MKTLRRFLPLLLLLAFLSGQISPALPTARAQSEAPEAWGEFLNPDGSINWSNLTYIGDISEPADWMNIEIPGGIQVPLGEATYSRYVTPSGNVLVLPSPATMFMAFMNPEASGLANNPPEMLGTGYEALAALAANYISLSDLQAMGYVDPAAFFQAVINGQENIWSLITPNFLFELVNMSLDAGFLVTALWLYLSGNCDAVPGGCPEGLGALPTPGPGEDPPPAPAACPPPTITYDEVSVTGSQVAPPHPVVVGQDPEKRGVDVEATIRIPPVVLTWFETRTRTTCEYVSSGRGSGCPGPGRRYNRVIDANGDRTSWSASMEGNSHWDRDTDIECIEHVEIFPDYLDYAVVNLNLSQESRAWILNDLAAAYPGASLKHPDWQFAFHGPGSGGGNGVVTWTQLIPNIQTADPGLYRLRALGRTTGTAVSAPREFDAGFGTFQVELLRVTLIEAP